MLSSIIADLIARCLRHHPGLHGNFKGITADSRVPLYDLRRFTRIKPPGARLAFPSPAGARRRRARCLNPMRINHRRADIGVAEQFCTARRSPETRARGWRRNGAKVDRRATRPGRARRSGPPRCPASGAEASSTSGSSRPAVLLAQACSAVMAFAPTARCGSCCPCQ